MATALVPGVEAPVTLATTVGTLTGVSACRKLLLLESDVAVYVVTTLTADGGALPSTGRLKFAAATLPVELDISSYGFVALAGSGAGTCRVEFRR